MKKIYMDDLPIHVNGSNKGKINWKNCVGLKVQFINEDTEGEVEITQYNGKNSINIKYNNIEQRTSISSFVKCNSTILNNRQKHKYKIGEVIKNKFGKIKIIELTKVNVGDKKVRGYKYQCLIDGYIGYVSESSIKKGTGCQVCSNRIIIKGINDVATTHPYLVKYFVNIEDAYKYSIGSGVKVKLKCPYCGQVKTKLISICDVNKYGFSCDYCNDGKSYPEKFIANLLYQLKIKFKTQHSPKFKKNIQFNNNTNTKKIYDFYIPSINCIIEAHGEQHYTKTFAKCGGRTLQEEQDNDKLKEKLAKENGIEHYIIIDCRKSQLQHIKNNVLNSKLAKLFDLTKVDWLKCEESALSSLIIGVCSKYDKETNNIDELSKYFGLSYRTINNYLNKGKIIGICNYDGRQAIINSLKKKVLCINNDIIYDSIKAASIELNLDSRRISDCCHHIIKQTKGYKFEYA